MTSQDDEMCVKVALTEIPMSDIRAAKQLAESISFKSKVRSDKRLCTHRARMRVRMRRAHIHSRTPLLVVSGACIPPPPPPDRAHSG